MGGGANCNGTHKKRGGGLHGEVVPATTTHVRFGEGGTLPPNGTEAKKNWKEYIHPREKGNR